MSNDDFTVDPSEQPDTAKIPGDPPPSPGPLRSDIYQERL